MADERPPIEGGDASDFEAAAKAARAKAQKTKVTAEHAIRETRGARAKIEDAETILRGLDDEFERVKKANARLSKTQRELLAHLEEFGDQAPLRAGFRQSAQALAKQGALTWQPVSQTDRRIRAQITDYGRGVHNPHLVAEDIGQQQQYIERLKEEATRDVQTAVREDKKTAESQASAAKQIKQRAVSKPKVPAAPNLTGKQRDLLQEYINAAQQGGTSEAEIKRVNDLRAQLRTAGLPATAIGQWGQIPKTTTPGLGTKGWHTELAKAQKSPGFSFTPDPKRLAREMARAAGGLTWFPEELIEHSSVRGKGNQSTADAKKTWVSDQNRIVDALAPMAQERLGQLPPAARKKIDDAVRGIESLKANSRTSTLEMETAVTKLLNTVEQAQGVGETAARKPKITYASPAIEKQIKAENARRAAVEKMRAAGAGWYGEPIGPVPRRLAPPAFVEAEAFAQQQDITAPSRRAALEAERRKVVSRLSSAERRYEGNEMSTPANQARIEATLEKHKAHLERLDREIDKTYREENEAQARRESGTVRQRIGVLTPNQERARAQRLEREAKIAAHRAQRITVDIPGMAHTSLMDTYAVDPGNDPEGVRAVKEAELIKRGRGHTARLTASRKAIQDIMDDNAARLGVHQSESGSFNPRETAALKKANENLTAALAAKPTVKPPAPPAPAPAVEAAAVEKAEERKTTAVEQGTKKRTAAKRDERAADGDLEELERDARQHADRMAAALDPENRRRLAEKQAPVTDPADQERGLRELEGARNVPPPPPPPPPPAPPGPPDDPGERRRLLQRLRDALARRVAAEEAVARAAQQETRDQKVAKEVARRKERAEIAAAAKAQLAAEQLAARVGPEHEQTAQRVQQERLDRRLSRAKERQARQVEAQAQAQASALANERQAQGQRLTDLLAQRRAALETQAVERQAQGQRLADMLAQRRSTLIGAARAAGAGQYGQVPIGPALPTEAEAMRMAGAGQYDVPAGPRKPTRRERSEVNQARRRRESAQTQVDESAATFAEATRLSNEYAQAQGRLGSAIEKTSIAADLSSQRFRKHGALTTEFIEAAAKGQVTVAELGYQLTATVGKFAGWTAAASAVYGVVGALSQVAEGAIAASSSIGLVGRVVTEQFAAGPLVTGEIDLAQKFNLPMQDVADAVYGAGKSFHDLPGALRGAEAALFAMKVGELDAGAATQSLTAIVNGFKLGAGELGPVMDTVNNVTNKFGGNVGQLVQGVAKASGQFLSAGGNYRELVAILTTGARLTGSTAEEVATAVGRSASVLRTPAGAARARAAGLDPTLDPLAVLQQAAQLGRGASPERVQELARALVPAGGQFARIMVPLIQNAELLNKVLAETTPEKTKGSAQSELAKVMGTASEEIKKIGNNLQQLGAALAQSGLLAPIMLFVKGINLAIRGVTDLVQLFSAVIPDPFKGPLATLLELYAVLRLMRRFDIGGQIAPGGRFEAARQFVSASPGQTSKRQILQGIGAEKKFLVDTRERVAQNAAVAAFREKATQDRLAVALGSGDDKLIARRYTAAQRASEQAADLADEEGDLRRLINQNDERRIDTLKGIRQGQTAEQALLAAGGQYRTDVVDRPTTKGPVHIGVSPGGVILPAGQVRQVAQDADQLQGRMSGFGQAATRLGVSGRAVAATARGATNATRAANSGLRAAAGGLGRLAVGIGAALGPLDLIILGIVGTLEAVNQFQKQNERHEKRIKAAMRPSSDPDQLQRQIDTLPLGPGPPAPGAMRFGNEKNPDAELRKRLEAEQRALVAQQAAGRALRTGVIEQRLATEKAVAATPKEEVAALQTALKALDEGYAAIYGARDLERAKKSGDKDAIAAAEAVIDRAAAAKQRILTGLNLLASAGSAVDQALAAASDFKGLSAFIGQQGAKFELAGGTGPAGAALAKAGVRAAQLYAESGDTVEFLKSVKEAEEAIVSAAETRLERALAVAKSPAARRRARRTFRATVREDIGVDDTQKRIDLIDEQQESRKLRIGRLRQKAQTGGGQNIDPLTGKPKLGGLPGSGLTPEEEAKLRALEQDVKTATKEERAMRQSLRRKKQLLKDIDRESKRAEFEEALALYEAHTDVNAARTPAGAARIAYQLRRIGVEIRRSIKEYGRNSKEVLSLIGEQLSLQAAAVDQEFAAIQAAGELAAAQAGSPAAEQAARARSLQDQLEFQKAHPERYDPKVDVVQTQAQILENAKQKREAADDKYRELLDARYAYLASLTDDPVKLARLEEQKANEVLARGGLDQAERYRALADRNNARRERENAINARRMDELDLRHDIGRLSDQQYLAGLEDMWRGMKKGSEAWREMRAKILRFRHDMQEGAEGFSLDVGNIRLPTAYEVHRAIREGRDARQRAVVNNNPTVNMYLAPGDDGSAVVRTIDNYLGTSARSALRASADIGA